MLRNPKPETRNPKPETRNPKPETLSPTLLPQRAMHQRAIYRLTGSLIEVDYFSTNFDSMRLAMLMLIGRVSGLFSTFLEPLDIQS
jgi:hypothetical protein